MERTLLARRRTAQVHSKLVLLISCSLSFSLASAPSRGVWEGGARARGALCLIRPCLVSQHGKCCKEIDSRETKLWRELQRTICLFVAIWGGEGGDTCAWQYVSVCMSVCMRAAFTQCLGIAVFARHSDLISIILVIIYLFAWKLATSIWITFRSTPTDITELLCTLFYCL